MRDFTSGNISTQLIAFSAPMLAGSLLQQTFGIVDAIIVGRYLGGGALAAIGVSTTAFSFLTAVLTGLTTGVSVLLSQYYGAKNYDSLRRAISTSLVFLAAFSMVITALGVVFTPAILSLLGAPAGIFAQARAYMRVQMWGLVFPVFYNMYASFMRALGNSRAPLYFVLIATLLNALLDALFVIILQYGMTGAALATVVSQASAVCLCFIYTRLNIPLLRVKKLVFDYSIFKLVLKYGAPAAFQLSYVSLAGLTITRLVNAFGAQAMAGITAANRIDNFVLMPVSMIGLALSTFVAQNMGAGLEERSRRGLKVATLMMVGYAVFVSLILTFFGSRAISMFVNHSDPESALISRTGSEYLSILVIFYFLNATLFSLNGFFRGAGDAVAAMAGPVASLTIRSVSAHALVSLRGMGPEALAWSIPIGWGLCSLASMYYYKKRLWAGKIVV